MRKVSVQFLFFDDEACNRCKTAEDDLGEAIKEFKKTHKDLEMVVKKQKLSKEEIEKSPTILLDSIDLESYLSQSPQPKTDYCEDCSCLIGQPVSCRTYGNGKILSKDQILTALERHVAKNRNSCSC